MELAQYFKSVFEEDKSAVVICNLDHRIIYMNPTACEQYKKYGGAKLLGNSLLDCHPSQANEMIFKVVEWFKENKENRRMHTFYNEKQNKDVYMVALRDEEGELIGYYEKHEYRNRDMEPMYQFES